MKRRIVGIVLILLLAALAAGCGMQEGTSLKQNTGQEPEAGQPENGAMGDSGAESSKDPEREDPEGTDQEGNDPAAGNSAEDARLEEAYGTILGGCTREFIGGYLLDEAFLLWITGHYGEDVIYGLAQAVEQGQTDAELWYTLTGSSIHVLWSSYCRDTGIQSYNLERVYWKDCADPDYIVLDFIGDLNFAEGWSTMEYLDKQVDGIFDCVMPDVMAELTGADILVVNNEFAYSTRGEPIPGKDYTFRAHPDRVYLLELLGTDLASLANNHAYDYGPDALLDTMETLRNAGIPYVGAGKNLEEAMEPTYFIANGRKIAIVAATQIERSYSYTKEATENEPGVLKTLDPEKFVQVIQKAEACADYVIVYVHWGTEQSSYFEGDQTALARAYVDAGADAIIGGHTHCLQGCQYMDGVPIIYSLGNFWFNSNKQDTGIAQLVIGRDGNMDFRFIPCVQKMHTTTLAEGEDWTRIFGHMTYISDGVVFDENGVMGPKE